MELELAIVQKIFMSNYDSRAEYHNWFHVSTVSSRALEIAVNEGDFTDRELLLLSLACYMHDIGYNVNTSSDIDNVERSVNIFKKNANKLLCDISNEEVELVVSLIRATKYPHEKPNNLLESIIQDADITQCWDSKPSFNAQCLMAEGKEVTDLFFPETTLLNTTFAKKKTADVINEQKKMMNNFLYNNALIDVIRAYEGSYRQDIKKDSLEALKLIKELF